MASSTVYSNVDSWVDENVPSKNHGQSNKLLVSNTTNNKKYIYLWFPKPFPDGASVTSAVLSLYLKGTGWTGGPHVITAKSLSASWKENKLIWSNKPGVRVTYTPTVSITGGAEYDLAQISLTQIMGEISAGSKWFGIRLEVDTTGSKSIFSSESGNVAYHASCDITWNEGPLQPTELRPSGGHATSLSLPTLIWAFQDSFGDIDQAKSQVQISTTTSFTSPAYDSTMIANTVSEWDLALTAYGGFTNNTTYYWRVRVQDASGLNSDWSDTAELIRRTKGTSALTSPGATVLEITPPVTHSALSGRTQEATEYFLYEEDPDTLQWVLVWHRERLASTAVTLDIPDGYIRNDGYNYRIIERIYDTIERDVTPGDEAYVELTQDFVFARSAITGTAALTVVAAGPGVTLTWTKAVIPDFWVIKVNDLYIDPHGSVQKEFLITAADLFISGTTYGITLYNISPGSNLFEVEAVVDTAGVYQHSVTNDTETFASDSKGVWLIEPTEPVYVQLIATEEPDMAIGEDSTLYNPLGSRRPVIITSAIRGYEGNVSGLLNGTTYRDDLLKLLGQMNSKQLRLMFSDLNIPVLIQNVTGPTPLIMPPLQNYYEAGFDFFQNGEYTFALDGEN